MSSSLTTQLKGTARANGFGAALLLALALSAMLALGAMAMPLQAQAATNDKAPKVQWTQKKGDVYCKVNGTAQKGGIKTIDGKKYLFSKKGVQLTSWHKVGKYYYYFTPKTKAKGSMVTNKVVNGIRLDNDGHAMLNDTARAELNVLTQATAFVEKYTHATWSEKKKLRVSFNVLRDQYTERALRGWTSVKGWHRLFAMEVFSRRGGSCYSFGAAFAYIANAIGCKSCKVVSSGGHGWAEVNGDVYDPEWSKNTPLDIFAFPMSRSGGAGGVPGYKSFRVYIVTLAPHTTVWKSTSTSTSTTKRFGKKSGLVTSKGQRYYVENGKPLTNTWETWKGSRYYFKKNGVAATGPTKIKSTWYVFDAKGRLLKGKKTRVVTVAGKRYQVTSSGKAKSGWDANKTHRFAANGRMYTGTVVINEKFLSFSAKGVYDAQKTTQLRKAAVMDADVAPLLNLLGKPKKVDYSPSCYMMTDDEGNELHGEDGRLKYPNFTVYTFKADNGIEYYRGAE